MNTNSFTLFAFQYDKIRDFTIKQKAELFDAIFYFIREDGRPEFRDPVVEMAFEFMLDEEILLWDIR